MNNTEDFQSGQLPLVDDRQNHPGAGRLRGSSAESGRLGGQHPFVNAEECEYLVIEDDFPNGRPCLGK